MAGIVLVAAFFACWFATGNGAAAGEELTDTGIAAYFRQIKRVAGFGMAGGGLECRVAGIGVTDNLTARANPASGVV